MTQSRAGAKKRLRRGYQTACAAFLVFVLFTVLAATVGTAVVPAKEIAGQKWVNSGTETVRVGFSGINVPVSDSLGYSGTWYKISKYLGYACILLAVGCAAVFPWQLIRRRSVRRVDHDVQAMVFLVLIFAALYFLFELLALNYRPVIVDPAEWPEASYPSTHTLMGGILAAGCGLFLRKKLRNTGFGTPAACAAFVLGAATVVTRFLSGVHWLTDIVGGLLLSLSVILLFKTLLDAR